MPDDPHPPNGAPEPNDEVQPSNPRPSNADRRYVVSATQVRRLFLLSVIGSIGVIVGILALTSARPRARYTPADREQYTTTVTEASETINAYARREDSDRVRIPIDRAIAIVAEQGIGVVSGAQQAETAPAAPSGDSDTAQGDMDSADMDSADTGDNADTAETPTPDAPTTDEPRDESPEAAMANVPDGAPIYASNCSGCHQANGQGITGAFPPIAGHAPELYVADRNYLPKLLLWGLQGQIQVNGQGYNGVMPAWQQLSDADIAGILNYILTDWGNDAELPADFAPYTPDDIASQRSQRLSSQQVYQLRQGLGLE